MIGIYSILLGVVIVAIALFLLRREFMRAYFIASPIRRHETSASSSDEVVLHALNDVEQAMKEMSEAFYDITGDLEANYSVHDKELQLLTEKIIALEERLSQKEVMLLKQTKELKRLNESLKKDRNRRLEKEKMATELLIDEPVEVAVDIVEEQGIERSVEDFDKVNEAEHDIKAKIITLRGQGYSLRQIAKSLDIGLGEIQLILNMKRP